MKTQNKVEHTPTPYKYELGSGTIRSCKENYWLATIDSWDGAINNQANATFIVKACNSHYELLEALKYITEICALPNMEWESLNNAVKQANQTIAKAERKE